MGEQVLTMNIIKFPGDGNNEHFISRLTKENEALKARIAELSKLVYVPGLMRCPKCRFELVSASLNLANGSITAKNSSERCPNDSSPMWKVTEREWREQSEELLERVCFEASDLREELDTVRKELKAIESRIPIDGTKEEKAGS